MSYALAFLAGVALGPALWAAGMAAERPALRALRRAFASLGGPRIGSRRIGSRRYRRGGW